MARPLVRLYCDVSLPGAGHSMALPRAAAHYIGTVMRSEVGTRIEIFNGRDGSWTAEITSTTKSSAIVVLHEPTSPQETPADIWLCAAPLKKDRIDWLAEKACELGIAEFHPVITRRTIVGKLNTDRLRAHMIEAAEQCNRTHLPPVAAPVKLEALLRNWPTDRVLLFCDEAGGTPLPDWLRAAPPQPVGVLIGPEGGFDAAERVAIRAHRQAVAIGLGPRILRADTAAVAALSVIQALWSGWS